MGSNPPHDDDDEPPEITLKDLSVCQRAGEERSDGEMLGSSTTRMMTVRLFFRTKLLIGSLVRKYT